MPGNPANSPFVFSRRGRWGSIRCRSPAPRRAAPRLTVFPPTSGKKLTAGRAAQFIKSHFPQFATAGRAIVIGTSKGWEARRAVEPLKKCSYQYVWEYLVLSEEA